MTSVGAGQARGRAAGTGRRILRAWGSRLRRFSSALAAPHPGLWAATAVLVAADALWLVASGIALEPFGSWLVSAVVGTLLLAAGFWGHVRSEPTLRAMALATAFLLAFTAAAAPLHYLAATLALPLVDEPLARAEAALGFDWPAHLAFLEAHPALARVLALAYHSSGPQVALVVIALSATRRLGRLWRFVRLFAVTLLVVIAVSSLLPAAGPYVHYAPRGIAGDRLETVGALWHLDALARLRGGTMEVIALGDIRGLATFPSFHVCLALLTAWALAPVPVIGPLALAVNAAVVIATLGAGGHYLPDVLAGALLTLALLGSRGRARAGLSRGFRGLPALPERLLARRAPARRGRAPALIAAERRRVPAEILTRG